MQHERPSSPGSSNRTALVVLRVLGLLVGGLGLFLAYISITEFIRDVLWSPSTGGVIGAIVFNIFLALLAFWCLRSSYQSWRSKENVPFRSLSAIVAIFVVVEVGPMLDKSAQLLPGLTVVVWHSILFLGVVVLASTLYVSLTWWLSAAYANEPVTHRIPEFLIFVVCVLLWLTSNEFFAEVIPKEPGYGHVPRFPWGLMSVTLPFAISIIVGRFLRRCGSNHDKHNTTSGAA